VSHLIVDFILVHLGKGDYGGLGVGLRAGGDHINENFSKNFILWKIYY